MKVTIKRNANTNTIKVDGHTFDLSKFNYKQKNMFIKDLIKGLFKVKFNKG